jgi:hypothetical protein
VAAFAATLVWFVAWPGPLVAVAFFSRPSVVLFMCCFLFWSIKSKGLHRSRARELSIISPGREEAIRVGNHSQDFVTNDFWAQCSCSLLEKCKSITKELQLL